LQDPQVVVYAYRRTLAREFLASALYLAIVVFTALIVIPESDLPSDRTLVLTIFGTSIGLILAHWFSFRLASVAVSAEESGFRHGSEEAAAQVTGGLVVAILASLPFIFADGETAYTIALFELALLPGVAGLAIGRVRGRSWVMSVGMATVAVVIACAVAAVKVVASH
jgi:hypothetical protein